MGDFTSRNGSGQRRSRRRLGMGMSSAMIGVAIVILAQLPCVIVGAKTVSIPETGITFDAPEDFSPLTREELLDNFPGDPAPAYAIGNRERTCVIAYDLTSIKFPPEKLPEAKSYLESILPKQLQGLVWIRKELITIQSQQWIYFEGTQSGDDGAVHNILLFTSFRGRMLRISFNSNKEDFPQVERAYRDSIKTISLRSE